MNAFPPLAASVVQQLPATTQGQQGAALELPAEKEVYRIGHGHELEGAQQHMQLCVKVGNDCQMPPQQLCNSLPASVLTAYVPGSMTQLPCKPLLFVDRHGSFSLCDLTTTPM
jgi:hypothetical protein